MSQGKAHNRQIVLAQRPQGAPVPENFRLENTHVPEPADGQVLLRTEYLSLDPYMRGRMSDAPSYAEPVKVGDVMVGGTVCRVEASRHPDYRKGEWVPRDQWLAGLCTLRWHRPDPIGAEPSKSLHRIGA